MDRRSFVKAFIGGVALAALPIPPAPAAEPMEEVLLDAICRDGPPTTLHIYDPFGDCLAVFGLPTPKPASHGLIEFDLPGPLTLEATERITISSFSIFQGDDVLIHGAWDRGPYNLFPGDTFNVKGVRIAA